MQAEIEYHADKPGILDKCIKEALKSNCSRSRCGCVILKGKHVVSIGYNKKMITCDSCIKDSLPASFKSDRTCCIHAEQMAILNIGANFYSILHSYLFFIRIDEAGKPLAAGDPYCTICSKMALFAGIDRFCLWNGDKWVCYDTDYYNELSFKHAD